MAHNRNGDKMKKLLRTMVVAPMYLFIYGIAFSWAFTNSFWGFLALAGLDLLGVGVVLLMVYRVTNVHGWHARSEVTSISRKGIAALVFMAIMHVIAAFMPSGEVQAVVGYFLPFVPIALGIIYALMEGLPKSQ